MTRTGCEKKARSLSKVRLRVRSAGAKSADPGALLLCKALAGRKASRPLPFPIRSPS